jgi:hypothetical protein
MLIRGSRDGFSLAELLVAFTLLAVLGATFTRIMVSQARFSDQQNALRMARAVARQGMNLLVSEARMVQEDGVDSVASDRKLIRLIVPYRYGLNCGLNGSANIVSMLPVDSLVNAQAVYAGWAYRSGSGAFVTVPLGVAPVTSTNSFQCTTTAQIKTLTINGHVGEVLDVGPGVAAPTAVVGQAVFFYQKVTYELKASATFPGQNGLYRTVAGGSSDELVAPLDTSTRFKFWTSGAPASVSVAPSKDLIRGFDVVFVGKSSYSPMGKSTPAKSTVVASIFFKNVKGY